MIIICPNTNEECRKTITYIPKRGFLIISDKENSEELDISGLKNKKKSDLRQNLDDVFFQFGYTLIDAMGVRKSGDSFCKICNLIQSSAFGIALITNQTPPDSQKNIYLEIGLMKAFGKEVVIITDNRKTLATDLVGKENLQFTDFKDMQSQIQDWLESLNKDTISFTNFADIFWEDSDYEMSFEYYKKAIMCGDSTALSNLKKNYLINKKHNISLPKRLDRTIRLFSKYKSETIIQIRDITSIALSLTDFPEGWFSGKRKNVGNFWEYTSTFRITRKPLGYPTVKSVIYRYNSIEAARIGYKNAKEKQKIDSHKDELDDLGIGDENYGYFSWYPLAMIIFRRANLLTRTEYITNKNNQTYDDALKYAQILDGKILSYLH